MQCTNHNHPALLELAALQRDSEVVNARTLNLTVSRVLWHKWTAGGMKRKLACNKGSRQQVPGGKLEVMGEQAQRAAGGPHQHEGGVEE